MPAVRTKDHEYKILTAMEFIKSNPSFSVEQLRRTLGYSHGIVVEARRLLVADGTLAPYGRTPRVGPTAPPLPPYLANSSDVLAKIEARRMAWQAKKKKTLADVEQELEHIAFDTAIDENRRIPALQKLMALKASKGDKGNIGPGPPLTDEAKVERLSLLLKACGVELSQRAWADAFGSEDEGLSMVEHGTSGSAGSADGDACPSPMGEAQPQPA